MTVVTRADIVTEARRWVGTPYRDLGRNEHGLDCVGLILVVFKGLGLITYEVPTYRLTPDGTFLSHFPKAGFTRVSPAAGLPGDVLAFKMLNYACHCGIITPTGVVHAYSVHRGVFEQVITETMKQTVVAAFRAPGVT